MKKYIKISFYYDNILIVRKPFSPLKFIYWKLKFKKTCENKNIKKLQTNFKSNIIVAYAETGNGSYLFLKVEKKDIGFAGKIHWWFLKDWPQFTFCVNCSLLYIQPFPKYEQFLSNRKCNIQIYWLSWVEGNI